MKLNIKTSGRKILPVLIGAALGYTYWYYIGCTTGTCPITSNPYTTTGYGALMGAIFAFPSKSKKKVKEEDGNN